MNFIGPEKIEMLSFANAIAQGAAVNLTSLSPERIQAVINRYSEHELKNFRRYCKKIELKISDDAILIGQAWFIIFNGDPAGDFPFNGEREKEILYKYIFSPFSDDEAFVCRFLSIPQELHLKNKNAGKVWVSYCLACWILKHEKEPDTSNVFEAASRLLMREKIIFPEKIVSLIHSSIELDMLVNNIHDREIDAVDLLLYKVIAAIDGGDKWERMLEVINEHEDLFSLYLVRYRYTNEKFVQQDFLDYLFALKEPIPSSFKKCTGEIYPLYIIQAVDKHNMLTEQLDLNVFYERAIQETEPSCIELYKFLKLKSYCHNIKFANSAEQINSLKIRCGKMLRTIWFIEKENFSEGERNLYYACAWLAVKYLLDTGKAWKALKPLIIAFRTSNKVLLKSDLQSINHRDYMDFSLIFDSYDKYCFKDGLPEMIESIYYTSFIESLLDQKGIKEIRADMANDLIDYFTPIKEQEDGKTKHQAEQYTEFERKEEGFDLNLREPSPFWRYAYIHALADLDVKMDLKGHYFHNQLEKVSQTDPSNEVRKAARKTMEKLDANRLGITGVNHGKYLIKAFWWLKLAHMLSLGEKVDKDRANSMRSWELLCSL